MLSLEILFKELQASVRARNVSTYADISNSREEGVGKIRPRKAFHFSAFSRLQLEGMKMYTFFFT